MNKRFMICITIAAGIFLLGGCSGAALAQLKTSASAPEAQVQITTASPVQIATPAPAQTASAKALTAAQAAKAAADADESGAPYFVAYEYDATNYLVSAYQTQQGPGSYSGGGALYLVDKQTGAVTNGDNADVSGVDFSKFAAVYSKLSGKIIE